jgi:putative ABC transport system permease protein
VKVLDRKLLRDLGRMKGQVITIAIVVARGIAVFVSALSTYDSLRQSQQDYYATARFAQVFAHLKRAPMPLVPQMREIPGIAEVEPRLIYDVTLDVAGVAAPVVGRMIGVPTSGQPTLNRLYLRRGRLIDAAHAHEVVISEGFALANHLSPGDQIAAILNGRRQELEIVGVVLSAEYVYAIRAGDPLPDNRQFGIVWINHDTLASAFTMEGAFNNVVLTLAPRASEPAVIAALDHLCTPYGGLGAYSRNQQLSHLFLSEEIRQQEVMATTMPPVFVAVAIFLLHVVLGRIVIGQREQIAALKALGYDNLTVGLHYLK